MAPKRWRRWTNRGGTRSDSGGRKTRVWVRCGPRSTDSSPELCPGRSRKIYNADVFSRRGVSLLDSYGSFLRPRRESTKSDQKDEDGSSGVTGKRASQSHRTVDNERSEPPGELNEQDRGNGKEKEKPKVSKLIRAPSLLAVTM